MYDNGWWGHMGGMWITWAIVLVLMVVLLVRWLPNVSRGSEPRHESAIEILKRRYAQGEIGKEEYERKLADLHH